MKDLKRVAVVPARGGSKRLPRKNIIDFHGKPIIGYTIEAALKTSIFERVLVSTEDAEIAAISLRFGAEVAERPVGLATDRASVVEVCAHLLEQEGEKDRLYDILCCLYATAPLRTADDIIKTVQLIEPGYCDFALAVTTYSHYPFQALRITESGMLEPMWPDLITCRSDRFGPLTVGNGSTYAVSTRAFQVYRSFYGPNMRGYIMPQNRSIDIDDPEDLKIALHMACMEDL